MAKGRRLTSSRSERLLGVGSYNYYQHNHHETVSEFGEEDVWSMVEDTSDNHHHHQHPGGGYGGSANDWPLRAATESGGRRHQVGGLSLAFEERTTSSNNNRIVHQYGGATGGGGGGTQRSGRHVANSAPVNVPDWSKILRVNSAESLHDSDEDDRLGESGMEPPHEYLARSRKTNAMSVYEGVGRTLKGRDMSRVRDAVWSQTGFEG